MQKEIAELEKQHPGQIGVYIKDLSTGQEYSNHADENWYLASTVKVPMAIEVLRQVDAKKISLDDEVEITTEDYVDGNGPLVFMKPGEKVTIRYLVEQMIVWSDNMASDMLLRVVGLDNVNQLLKSIDPALAPVTTLKDVRRHIYGGIHTKGFELQGENFLTLEKTKDPVKRLTKFKKLFNLKNEELQLRDIDEAYSTYYKKNLNSASPRNYSKVLEALWEGNLLGPSSREFLVQTMLKTETGKRRIKAGLKGPWVFAHKTGTQYKRIGDVGYVFSTKDTKRKPLIVVTFVRDIQERKASEKILEKVGEIISKSGVL